MRGQTGAALERPVGRVERRRRSSVGACVWASRAMLPGRFVGRACGCTPSDRQTRSVGEQGAARSPFSRIDGSASTRSIASDRACGRADNRRARLPARCGNENSSLAREELGDGDRGRTLVFVRTKRGADRLVKRWAPRRERARHPRQPVTGAAREGAEPLPRRLDRHARGHRCGRARDRRGRSDPCDQLRRSRGPRRLRSPRGAYWPCWTPRGGDHARHARPGQSGRQDRTRAAPARTVRAHRAPGRRGGGARGRHHSKR